MARPRPWAAGVRLPACCRIVERTVQHKEAAAVRGDGPATVTVARILANHHFRFDDSEVPAACKRSFFSRPCLSTQGGADRPAV